jgi:hypothetical protein
VVRLVAPTHHCAHCNLNQPVSAPTETEAVVATTDAEPVEMLDYVHQMRGILNDVQVLTEDGDVIVVNELSRMSTLLDKLHDECDGEFDPTCEACFLADLDDDDELVHEHNMEAACVQVQRRKVCQEHARLLDYDPACEVCAYSDISSRVELWALVGGTKPDTLDYDNDCDGLHPQQTLMLALAFHLAEAFHCADENDGVIAALECVGMILRAMQRSLLAAKKVA